MNIKERIAKLIDVKSIMTMILTIGFVTMTAMREITGREFLTIFTMVVSFYFGTQSEKKKTE